MMHWACWSAFAELATKLGEDPIRPGKPAILRRGFVMTDELMLFLALAGGFTLCWWNGGCVKHHDGYRDPSEQRKSNDRGEADAETNPPLVEGNVLVVLTIPAR